jgi:hypothetical protein
MRQAPLHPLVKLGSSIGNQAVLQLLRSRAIQAKLDINQPGDVYEQEADRIADQVLSSPAHPTVIGAPSHIQRFIGGLPRQRGAAPNGVNNVLRSDSSPLEPALRQDMEQRFGHDFSRVRVHFGAAAEESARELNAKAYTVGSNIVFGVGQFAPGTHEGRRLIAHELAHVLQQSVGDRNRVGRSIFKDDLSSISQEHQIHHRSPRRLQRKPSDQPPIDKEKNVAFKITFDKSLTREEFIALTERTIYGRQTNMTWTGVKDKYDASNSPVWAWVPVSTLQGRLKDYGESASKVIQGIEKVEDAATYRRLNTILQKLTPAQWADFENRITGKTENLDEFEKAVDAYLAAQQQREAERMERDRLVSKLYGRGDIYQQYRDFRAQLNKEQALAAVAGTDLQTIGASPTLIKMRDDLEAALKKASFPGGIVEFEKFIQDYLTAFRSETVKIGLDILQQYDSILYKENERYQDPATVAALHAKLAPLRTEFAEVQKSEQAARHALQSEPYKSAEERSRLPGQGGTTPPIPEETKAAIAEGEKHKEAARQSVVSISDEFPVLKEEHLPVERRIDKTAMAKADPAQLSTLLKSHIQARRDDIKKTRETLTTDPEKVFSLDNLLAASLRRQRVDSNPIFAKIVEDKVSAIKKREAIIGFLVAVFAIALVVVSLGTGIVAAGAAVAGFALSSVLAYQEFKDYESKHAAAGTGLLSDDPSLVWVIVAVGGAALDLGQAVQAVKAISPLAKTLEATGDVAKFTEGLQALQKGGKIDSKIARSTEQAALARAKSAEAVQSLGRTLSSKAYSFPGPLTDPDVYKDVVKLAYYKLKEVGYDFLKFAEETRKARLANKLGDFSSEELTLLNKAYEEGKTFATEEDLLKYMKQTHPMGAAEATSVPKGKRTVIDPKDKDIENRRALGRENDSADILSQKGYNVEQNPNVPGASNPDYNIEGKIFDCYAPSEKTPARNIWSYIKVEKLEKGQTTRVVLNLQDWGGDIAALKKQFNDWPMAGLDEVIVIMKDKSIFHLVP